MLSNSMNPITIPLQDDRDIFLRPLPVLKSSPNVQSQPRQACSENVDSRIGPSFSPH